MLLPRQPSAVPAARRGAALMLTFLVLLILILILAQIKYSTSTGGRVARNETTLVLMDHSIESILLQAYEDLKADAEADAAGDEAGGDPTAALAGGGGGEEGPSDSREDEWSRPQRTEMNQIQLRLLIQDEDSKFNLLSILTEDEDEAEKAFERLTRVIEYCRAGTEAEIDGGEARRIASAMLEFMNRRQDQYLPDPILLSDDEDQEDIGLPLSLREFMAIDPEIFPEDLFRDFRDSDGNVVHSLGSFVTVWSSVATLDDAASQDNQNAGAGAPPAGTNPDGDEEGGDEEGDDEGAQAPANDPAATGPSSTADEGAAVNVNTAPLAVLAALMDDRDLPYRFWDSVLEYRNEEDEELEENEDPPLDEYGEEIVTNKFFATVDDLEELDGWIDMEPITQGELKALLKTESNVFSIYVTARKPTGVEDIDPGRRRVDIERDEAEGQGLVRTVRSVVWRRALADGEVEIVPIIRWEVLDYVPYEVLDDPEAREPVSSGRR